MEPQLFNFNGQKIRTLTINSQPYFIGKDSQTSLTKEAYQ